MGRRELLCGLARRIRHDERGLLRTAIGDFGPDRQLQGGQQPRSGLTGTLRGFVMLCAGRSRWFAVSAGLVLVASACNSTGSTNATTPEAGPPPVVVPEAPPESVPPRPPAAQTTARLQEPPPPLDPAPLVTTADGYIAVSAGSDHSCGVRTNGTIQCWSWITNLPEDIRWTP